MTREAGAEFGRAQHPHVIWVHGERSLEVSKNNNLIILDNNLHQMAAAALKIVGISGSLRSASCNTGLLRAVGKALSEQGVDFKVRLLCLPNSPTLASDLIVRLARPGDRPHSRLVPSLSWPPSLRLLATDPGHRRAPDVQQRRARGEGGRRNGGSPF